MKTHIKLSNVQTHYRRKYIRVCKFTAHINVSHVVQALRCRQGCVHCHSNNLLDKQACECKSGSEDYSLYQHKEHASTSSLLNKLWLGHSDRNSWTNIMTSLNRSFSHRVVTTFPKRVSAKSPLALRLLVAPMDTSSYMRKLTNDGSGLSGSGTRVLHLIDMCYSRVLLWCEYVKRFSHLLYASKSGPFKSYCFCVLVLIRLSLPTKGRDVSCSDFSCRVVELTVVTRCAHRHMSGTKRHLS